MKRIFAVAVATAALATAQQAYATDFCVGTTKLGAGPVTDNFGNGSTPAADADKCSPFPDAIPNVNQRLENQANGGAFDVFALNGSLTNGPITASLKHEFLTTVGTFTDRFLFIIPQNGLGTGGVQSTANQLFTATDLDFGAVRFWNGVQWFDALVDNTQLQSTAFLSNIPIFAGLQNILSVEYTTRANQGGSTSNAQFQGNITFEPVPEPSTWAMMLAGFGAIGFAMRRRKPQPKVRFAF